MSRWRHILLASPPSLSACPKPKAEKKHDLSPTDNDIKNGNMILCAGLLSVYALRSRRKAAAKITLSAALRLRHYVVPIRTNATCFLSSRALGHRKPEELFLPPRRDFAAAPPICSYALGRNGRAVAWGLVSRECKRRTTTMPNLTINGQSYFADAPSDTPLLWVIREDLRLTGNQVRLRHRRMRRLYGAYQWRGGALLHDLCR
jgi:hypothetical protein